MTDLVVFNNREPQKTIHALKNFLLANFGEFPEETRPRFRGLNADNNMASFLITGMELLNRFAQENPNFPARRAALETLGTVAFTVADIPLWDKGPRALQVLAWASSELNGASEGREPSPAVEPDEAYPFVQPTPPAPVAPVMPIADGGGWGQTADAPAPKPEPG